MPDSLKLVNLIYIPIGNELFSRLLLIQQYNSTIGCLGNIDITKNVRHYSHKIYLKLFRFFTMTPFRFVVIVTTSYFVIVIDICNTIVYGSLGASLISSTPALLIFSCLLNSSQHTQDRPSILNNPIRLSSKSTFVCVSRVLMQGSRGRHDFKYYHCTSTLFPLQF